jgi:hypothetical protein
MVDALKLCVCSLRPELGKPARRVRQGRGRERMPSKMPAAAVKTGEGTRNRQSNDFFGAHPTGFRRASLIRVSKEPWARVD